MAWKTTRERARKDLREGKRPTTAAGEYVREEKEHVRRGKHGVRSPQQAVAIGLSKARREGVPLPAPKEGRAKAPKREPRGAQTIQAAADRPRRRSTKRSSSSTSSSSSSSSSTRSKKRSARKR